MLLTFSLDYEAFYSSLKTVKNIICCLSSAYCVQGMFLSTFHSVIKLFNNPMSNAPSMRKVRQREVK